MEEMILAGRITVNRMPADVGQKVSPGDEVRINGDLVKVRFAEPRPRVLMYHKPAGELVTRDDPEGRPTVFEKLPSIGNGRWINVGRLDYNTEGLLLFTNSGELANRLMHPRYEVEREYAVRIMGRLSDEQMQSLTTGLQLDDGPARCEKVSDGGGDEDGSNHWYHVVLKEGRNREVRRLFEALGVMVSRLIRTRFGALAMPTHLKRGQLAELEVLDVDAIVTSAGLDAAQSRSTQRPDSRGPRHGKGKGPQPAGTGRHPGKAHPSRPPGSRGTRPPFNAEARSGNNAETVSLGNEATPDPGAPLAKRIRKVRAPGRIVARRGKRRRHRDSARRGTIRDAIRRSST
jgi:23S rRNA pseudouridine2605 synthase